jgi:UDP:flavonoid glycosyltransferase YjiC (YdhE family)
MKVLISTFPAPSHYFPMVPVGWALRASGHEVRVACPASFAAVVTASGLPAVTVPEIDLAGFWRNGPRSPQPPAQSPAQSPAAARTARAMAMFTAVAAGTAPPLTEFARRWRPGLVICEPRAYAGMVAADAIGVPVVRHLYGVDYTGQRAGQEQDTLRSLAGAFPSWRADPLGDLTIDPCPPSMQVPAPVTRQRVRYVPYNGPGTMPGWLLRPRRRPRICVTWGTTHTRDAAGLAPARNAIDALAGLDADLVAAVPGGGAGLLGRDGRDSPDGRDGGRLTVTEALPLHLLLPACDAVVHQGGAGTTMTAVACGTPQLVVPDVADRMLNAAQVAAAGAGRVLPPDDAGHASIRECVLDLLAGHRYQRATRSLQAEAASQRCPAAVVDALTELAAGPDGRLGAVPAAEPAREGRDHQ